MISSKGKSEGEIVAAILAYCELRKDLAVWRNNTGGFSPRPGHFLHFGCKGSADILACQAPMGRFIGIEVKRERGGTLSQDQKDWGAMLEAFGGLYIVARSVGEVSDALGPPKARVVKPPSARTRRVFPR